MSDLNRLKEAKSIANGILNKIDNVLPILDKAESWGFWDLIGGGFFTSLIKRNAIEDANSEISDINRSIQRLNKLLKEGKIQSSSEISDTAMDRFFDIWYDNIFTDFRVQGEIKECIEKIERLRIDINNIIYKLDVEIKKQRQLGI